MGFYADGERRTFREAWWRIRKSIAGLIAPEAIEYEQDMAYRFSCLLDHATGGRLSKTNYAKETMYREVDDYTQRLIDEAVEEATKGETK